MVGLGTTIACIIGGGALGLTAISVPFITPAFRRVCLPYVPATNQQIANVIKLLKKYPNASPIVDLGSGDGRVVCFCFIFFF
jgi:hypothetical protein